MQFKLVLSDHGVKYGREKEQDERVRGRPGRQLDDATSTLGVIELLCSSLAD